MWFADIAPKCGSSFYYLTSCFHRAHGFSLKEAVALLKNSSPNPTSLRFSPVFVQFYKFYSNPFYALIHFMFRSRIHLELIFMKDMRSVSGFTDSFLHLGIQLFQQHLLEKLSFLHSVAFVSWPRISQPHFVGVPLGSLLRSADPCIHSPIRLFPPDY